LSRRRRRDQRDQALFRSKAVERGSLITLCLPKITSEHNGGPARTRLGWPQCPRSVALPDLEAHPCPAPSADLVIVRRVRRKEFVAGAPRQRPALGPGTRDERC